MTQTSKNYLAAKEVAHGLAQKRYLAQDEGSWCFVCALYNCAIYLDRETPDLERAKEVAKCIHGCTIAHREVVEFFDLPLVPTDDLGEILERGGIPTVRHPIFNGHSFFVYPDGPGSVTMINSWLGPLVATGIGHAEVLQFASDSFTSQWVFDEPLPRMPGQG